MLHAAVRAEPGRAFPVGGYGDGFVGHLHSMFLPGAHRRARDRADPHPQPAREPARGPRVRLRRDRARRRGCRSGACSCATRCATRSSRRSPCSASTSASSSAARSSSSRSSRCPGSAADDRLDLPARLPGRAGASRSSFAIMVVLVYLVDRHRPRAARPAGAASTDARRPTVHRGAGRVAEHRGFRHRWYRTPSFVAGARRSSARSSCSWRPRARSSRRTTRSSRTCSTSSSARRRSTRSAPTTSVATSGRGCSTAARIDLQIALPRRALPVRARHDARAARRLLRRLADTVAMRLVDVVVAFPFYVLDHRARVRARRRARATSTSRSRSSAGCRTRASCAARSSWRSGRSTCSRRGPPVFSNARILRRHILPERDHAGDRLRDVRHRARHPRHRHPRLPRARRAAADARLGLDDRRRPDVPDDELAALDRSRGSRSSSPASASRCSATASPTSCGRNERRRSSRSATSDVEFPLARGVAPRRRRRVVHRRAAARRSGIVGESGSRQDDDAARDHRPAPAPRARSPAARSSFDGADLAAARRGALREIRGRAIAMIFQEPMTALNPVMRVGDQIAEGPRVRLGSEPATRRASARSSCMRPVGIPDPERRARPTRTSSRAACGSA